MCIVDQVKKIATYICEAFEDWGLDDPVEEGYLEDYQEFLEHLRRKFRSLRRDLEFLSPMNLRKSIATKTAVNS